MGYPVVHLRVALSGPTVGPTVGTTVAPQWVTVAPQWVTVANPKIMKKWQNYEISGKS